MILDLLFIFTNLMFHSSDRFIKSDKDVVIGVFRDEIVLVFSIQNNLSIFRAVLMFDIQSNIDRLNTVKVVEQLANFCFNFFLMFFRQLPMSGRHNDLHTDLHDDCSASVRHAM